MDGWMDGRKEGWMDGWMDVKVKATNDTAVTATVVNAAATAATAPKRFHHCYCY